MPGMTDVNGAIIRVARRHRYLAGRLLAELGLHPGQEAVLFLLWNQFADSAPSQAQLATAMGVEPPTLHRTLTSLERSGYVRRTASSTDGRVQLVELTDAGALLRPRIEQAWQDLEQRTVNGLSERDQRMLLRLLRRLAENLADGATVACPP
jgi:MarR family transcriptional regulator, organic hydroperoxide resistance regulator